MRSVFEPLLALLVGAALAACGAPGGSDAGGTTGSTGSSGGSGGGGCGLSSCDLVTATNAEPLTSAPDGGGAFNCSYQGLIAFSPCVSEGDSAMRVTVLCASPSPLVGGDVNTFTVAITDGAGNPMKDLPFSVSLYMPTMGHGAPAPPIANNGDGTYTIPTYLTMPGVWRIQFVAGADAGFSDTETFFFCVAESAS
jgi:hypothetical protein